MNPTPFCTTMKLTSVDNKLDKKKDLQILSKLLITYWRNIDISECDREKLTIGHKNLKMRRLVLIGFVLATVSAELVGINTNYFDTIGIPLARQIKQYEDSLVLNEDGTINPRIVGGVIAPISSYPYLAGLVVGFINQPWGGACGSSLLSSTKLVTAAHCWNDGVRQAVQFEVVMGSQFLFYGGTRIITTNVVMHPGYNPTWYWNDVAMITLPWSISLIPNLIQPIALPSGTDLNQSFEGFIATAIGYGRTSDSQVGVSTNTQVSAVNLVIISNPMCRMSFIAEFVQESNICTSGIGGVGLCGGDSGGPLVLNRNGVPTLIGISSYAAGTCAAGFPSGFARVTSFYSFILQHM